MRPSNFITSVLLFAAISTAWPWPASWQPLGLAKRELAPLVARQQGQSSSASATVTQANTATNTKTKATSKSGNNNNQGTTVSNSASGTNTKTGGNTKTTGKTTGKNTHKETTKYQTTKTYDALLPAGGISMVTPNIMSGSQYYKIQDYVTFAWNFTSLKATPTAVDVLASCSANSATYTIAMNQTIDGPTQAVTWDTGAYQASATVPLLVATYTLIVYDSDSSISDTPRAGYLGVYNQFTFGMYTPQPYTPMKDYVCATCNSAVSSMTRHTFGFLFGMVAVTVLSFGWFAGVAGLW